MLEEQAIVVLMTAGSSQEAERLAQVLVEARLAACVSIVPRVSSWYRWEGKVRQEEEVLLIAKTRTARLQELMAKMREEHSYETPEIIALPVIDAESHYFQWVMEQTQKES